MIEKRFIISQDKPLLEALTQINSLQEGPLVLFAVDDESRMVGTLTDGDSRRALIGGASVYDSISKIINKNFHSLTAGVNLDVKHIQEQRKLKMRLIPILDEERHIVDIINLDRYRTILPVDAVIMAGGKGERLRPLTETTPKPLLPVGGKAIIDYNVDRLLRYGVKHINVTVNYLAEQIESHFATPRGGVQVKCFREPKFLGTIGSIHYVDQFYNDTLLVMNSDVFTNINFEDFFLHFMEHNADMSACAIPYSVQIPYGIFKIEEKRNIKGLVEKPTYDYYANAGIYLIKKSVLDYIPANTMFHSTDLMTKLIEVGKRVIRFPLNGTWIDIGNPQEYKRANELVAHLHD